MSTRVTLAVVSFVVLIVHGIVFYDQFFNRWEKHQTAYFEQARSLAKTDAEKHALDERGPRIEQIIVTQFGESRVDRCATCHIASDDPRFQGHADPLRTHPYSAALGDVERNGHWERRHKFTDFGCTICHDGQGRGLETFYAHGEDIFWPDPMLGYVTQANWHAEFKARLTGKEYMQANCAQCHMEDNFAETPLVQRGRQLFFEKACYGCHRIEGLSNGTLGPDLSEVGKKFKVAYDVARSALRLSGDKERASDSENLPVPHRPSHDPAEHVTPAFVGRKDSIVDQKCRGPAVVGDHSEGDVGSGVLSIRDLAERFDLFKESFEEVCFIVAFDPLKDGRNPFQAHPGVNTGFGQRLKLTL